MKFGRRLEAEQEEAYRPYYLRRALPNGGTRCAISRDIQRATLRQPG